MSRIAATCYLSGSRLGVVFDDFGSTHGVISIFTCCCHAYTRPAKLVKMI